jgi:hypothetical protein
MHQQIAVYCEIHVKPIISTVCGQNVELSQSLSVIALLQRVRAAYKELTEIYIVAACITL